MDTGKIQALVEPFAGEIDESLKNQISKYIDIMRRWNEKVALTAVREPDDIVIRHFGESLFAARALMAADAELTVIDVGSGAGFPGMPLKLWAPRIKLTLVEANNKKATFLKEVIRGLALGNVNVVAVRAETLKDKADLVTLRAVERFDEILPIAGALVKPGGRLALLIGQGQVGSAYQLPEFEWQEPLKIPNSRTRVVLVGKLAG